MLVIPSLVVAISCICQVANGDKTRSKSSTDELTLNAIIEERMSKLGVMLKEQLDLKLRDVLGDEKAKHEKLENLVKKQQLDLKRLESHVISQQQEILDLKNHVEELRSGSMPNQIPLSVLTKSRNEEEIKNSGKDSKHIVETDEGRTTFVKQKTNGENREKKKQTFIHRDTRLLLGTGNPDAPTNVAFYAYLSKSETSTGPHHTLIFDHVETNIGNSYNSHTGGFTVPLDGVYLFSYTLFNERHAYGSYEIVVNSISRGAIFVDNQASPNVYTGTTGVAIFHLLKGDDCFIRTHSSYGGQGTIRSDNIMRTSFSGVKIGH